MQPQKVRSEQSSQSGRRFKANIRTQRKQNAEAYLSTYQMKRNPQAKARMAHFLNVRERRLGMLPASFGFLLIGLEVSERSRVQIEWAY